MSVISVHCISTPRALCIVLVHELSFYTHTQTNTHIYIHAPTYTQITRTPTLTVPSERKSPYYDRIGGIFLVEIIIFLLGILGELTNVQGHAYIHNVLCVYWWGRSCFGFKALPVHSSVSCEGVQLLVITVCAHLACLPSLFFEAPEIIAQQPTSPHFVST